MADKKSYTSPKGKLLFPWLTKADTKFDSEGKFKCTLALDPTDEDVLEFVAMVESWVEKIGGKNSPVSLNEETNLYEVKFASSYKPHLFDSTNKLLPEAVNVGSGTVAKVAFTPNAYKSKQFGDGINLYLKAVQIFELVEFGADGASYGFGEEEGGFKSEEAVPPDAPFDNGEDGALTDFDNDGDAPF